jgi:hypothetical protein
MENDQWRKKWLSIFGSIFGSIFVAAGAIWLSSMLTPHPSQPKPPIECSVLEPISRHDPPYLRRIVNLENVIGKITRYPKSRTPACMNWAMEQVSREIRHLVDDSDFKALLHDTERAQLRSEQVRELMNEGKYLGDEFRDIELKALLEAGVEKDTAGQLLSTVQSFDQIWNDEYAPINAKEIIENLRALASLADQAHSQISGYITSAADIEEVTRAGRIMGAIILLVVDHLNVRAAHPEEAEMSKEIAKMILQSALDKKRDGGD